MMPHRNFFAPTMTNFSLFPTAISSITATILFAVSRGFLHWLHQENQNHSIVCPISAKFNDHVQYQAKQQPSKMANA